jgi:predicted metal-dependent phosphoesterase TrpH
VDLASDLVPYDLHTHSTASDGTTSPGEVVRAAAAAGLTGLALTDHDTGAGLAEAAAAAGRAGIDLLPGVEISTSLRGRSVHLLGYGDITATGALAGVLAGTVASRHGRLRRIVERLRAVVPELTVADVLARVPTGSPPAGPTSPTRSSPSAWCRTGTPPSTSCSPSTGPTTSATAPPARGDGAPGPGGGGAAVVAHPGSRSAADLLDEDVVAELAEAGLVGLEVDHRDHDSATRLRLRRTSERLGLLATGASDFHGAGKQNLLAENTTPDEVVAELLARAGPAQPTGTA